MSSIFDISMERENLLGKKVSILITKANSTINEEETLKLVFVGASPHIIHPLPEAEQRKHRA